MPRLDESRRRSQRRSQERHVLADLGLGSGRRGGPARRCRGDATTSDRAQGARPGHAETTQTGCLEKSPPVPLVPGTAVDHPCREIPTEH
ncbi:hypothetical protein GCM10027445_16850 [Amycolatopsis endophytica]